MSDSYASHPASFSSSTFGSKAFSSSTFGSNAFSSSTFGSNTYSSSTPSILTSLTMPRFSRAFGTPVKETSNRSTESSLNLRQLTGLHSPGRDQELGSSQGSSLDLLADCAGKVTPRKQH